MLSCVSRRLDPALERLTPIQSSGMGLMSAQFDQEHEPVLEPNATHTRSQRQQNPPTPPSPSRNASASHTPTQPPSPSPSAIWLAQRTRNAALYNALREADHCRRLLRVRTRARPTTYCTVHVYSHINCSVLYCLIPIPIPIPILIPVR